MTLSNTNSGDPTKPGALAEMHAASLERAAIASEELRRSARSVRLANAKDCLADQLGDHRAVRLSDLQSNPAIPLPISIGFLAFFAAPAALAVIYFSLIASSHYTSEARFAVQKQ